MGWGMQPWKQEKQGLLLGAQSGFKKIRRQQVRRVKSDEEKVIINLSRMLVAIDRCSLGVRAPAIERDILPHENENESENKYERKRGRWVLLRQQTILAIFKVAIGRGRESFATEGKRPSRRGEREGRPVASRHGEGGKIISAEPVVVIHTVYHTMAQN